MPGRSFSCGPSPWLFEDTAGFSVSMPWACLQCQEALRVNKVGLVQQCVCPSVYLCLVTASQQSLCPARLLGSEKEPGWLRSELAMAGALPLSSGCVQSRWRLLERILVRPFLGTGQVCCAIPGDCLEVMLPSLGSVRGATKRALTLVFANKQLAASLLDSVNSWR